MASCPHCCLVSNWDLEVISQAIFHALLAGGIETKTCSLVFSIKEAFIKTSEAIHQVDTKPERATAGLCLT